MENKIIKTEKEIKEYLKEKDETLTCDVLKDIVIIYHGDYSVFHLENVYIEEDEDILYIWTEHCGYFHFHKEDLLFWKKLGEYPPENWFEEKKWKKRKL